MLASGDNRQRRLLIAGRQAKKGNGGNVAMFFSHFSVSEALSWIISNRWSGFSNKLRLIKADFTYDPYGDGTQFTEADFPGYAAINAPGIGGLVGLPSGAEECQMDLQTWTCTGSTAQTIYGWWLEENSAAHVYMCEKFASPISLTTAGQTVKIHPLIDCKTCLS